MSEMTLAFYDKNAEGFSDSTKMCDMTAHYSMFLQYLKPGARILDLGSGSGRDSKFFIGSGYNLEAVDGSLELSKLASAYIGKTVRHLKFDDLDYSDAFDGVWACASLLHVPKDELPGIFIKIYDALKKDGILYVSFKYGSFSGERNGRFFTDLMEQDLVEIIDSIKRFKIIHNEIRYDSRPEHSGARWLNAILRKIG